MTTTAHAACRAERRLAGLFHFHSPVNKKGGERSTASINVPTADHLVAAVDAKRA